MAKKKINDSLGSMASVDAPLILPKNLPLLPMRDVVVFPYLILPLFVGRDSSLAAVESALEAEQLIFLSAQKDSTQENPDPGDLHKIGAVAMIMRKLRLPDGRLKILVQGLTRARITSWKMRHPYMQVAFKPLEDKAWKESLKLEALVRNVREASETILALRGLLSGDVEAILNSVGEPGRLADMVAGNLRLKTEEAQDILECLDPVERLAAVNRHLRRELEVATLQASIESEAKEEMNKSQREYYLREQLKALRRELGDSEDRQQEVVELRKALDAKNMPEQCRLEAMKQLKRLEQMSAESSEAMIVRTYIDWIIDLPWNTRSKERIDIAKASHILEQAHYGLGKIKDRILEHLSVHKLNPRMKGPILCFLGPPGVGKTSLGKAIALALGREFVRLSLGGIRDEAEIRGHRRTYIGAMPGRILQGIKNAGTSNPVFMLDEIDKVGSDFRGDPTSALLEVLDPEQNNSFSDNYLNLPYDLSRVMFITTANLEEAIPEPLLDRMEVIELSGYTEEEKLCIARRHLLPRQIKDSGLKESMVAVSDEAILEIIRSYTRESGVRNLERELGAMCRKLARQVAEGQKGPFAVSEVRKFLGAVKYLPEDNQSEGEVGVVNGLAWTPVGGEVLRVEIVLLEGKGNLTITGSLGEIMKESAQAALSYARSRSQRLGLKPDFFENMDMHLHVPAGAIPKDGPSAGITICLAMISALTGIPARDDLALTGELTLTGKVLPIGGLKEKSLAALRARLKMVLAPAGNQKDREDLPASVRRGMEIKYISHMDQVLEICLAGPLLGPAQAAPKKKSNRTAFSQDG
jgi:ATP-dependent Lon protease